MAADGDEVVAGEAVAGISIDDVVDASPVVEGVPRLAVVESGVGCIGNVVYSTDVGDAVAGSVGCYKV